MEEGNRLCACGCGRKVRFRGGRWNKYYSSLCASRDYSKRRREYILSKIDNVYQSELHKIIGAHKKHVHEIVLRFLKLGLIRREKVLYKGKITYLIRLINRNQI
ncbi:MAG: hypothetical protein QXX95_04185 [Nitrososphaerales archaeon]